MRNCVIRRLAEIHESRRCEIVVRLVARTRNLKENFGGERRKNFGRGLRENRESPYYSAAGLADMSSRATLNSKTLIRGSPRTLNWRPRVCWRTTVRILLFIDTPRSCHSRYLSLSEPSQMRDNL